MVYILRWGWWKPEGGWQNFIAVFSTKEKAYDYVWEHKILSHNTYYNIIEDIID